MNFSRIAKQLNEENPALEASRSSGEKAIAGGEKQITKTNERKDRQKAQMAQQGSTNVKSDISYASEEARMEREMASNYAKQKSDWRSDLTEEMGEEGTHPYVDIMPSMNQKQREAKRQEKGAAKMAVTGGAQAKMAEAKELSIDDQMRISREAAKNRNPKPDHKAIRGRLLKKPLPDTRTQREKETQGRYLGGGRIAGD